MTKQMSQYVSAALFIIFGLAIFLFNFTSILGEGFTLGELGDLLELLGESPSFSGVMVTVIAWVAIAVGLALAFLAYSKNKLVDLAQLVALGLGVLGLVFYIIALDGSSVGLAFFVQLFAVVGIGALKFLVKGKRQTVNTLTIEKP
jgi:hypothetical protein